MKQGSLDALTHDTTGMLLTFAFIGMAVLLTVLGVRALIRRHDAKLAKEFSEFGATDRIALIDHGLPAATELDGMVRRVAELEERLDFAERLLAQRHELPSLPMHRTPV